MARLDPIEASQLIDEQIEQISACADQLRTISSGLIVDGDRVKLDVPYCSQWGVGANERPGDCGPASVAMLVHYLTPLRPTVDQVATSCRQPTTGDGSHWTGHGQLRDGAAVYGVNLASRTKWTPPRMTLTQLKEQVDRGLPSIVLVAYGVLRDRTDPIPDVVHNEDRNFGGGHWMVFIGYDGLGVYVHDPNFWTRPSPGASRFIPTDPFLASLQAIAPGNKAGDQGLVVIK